MIDKKTGEPYINVWFGNFYRPAYDNPDFMDKSLKLLKDCGFNSIMLDSKAWEDFNDRYNGKEASQYVGMQEYMQKRILEEGMSYMHLSLYLNADNLYPNIRFSPPIYGESVVNADGEDGKWYKYWSHKAKQSMIEHVKGLCRLYGQGFTNCTANGKNAKMMCTMWDPIVVFSFDADGEKRYIDWLKTKYSTISQLNKIYKTDYDSFDNISLKEMCQERAPQVFDADSPTSRMYADNMMWRRDEICKYFEDMQKLLKEIDSELFTCPDLAQWSYFLNIDASSLADVGFSDLWDTANRGIDIYKLTPYLDCTHWITVPVTPFGEPDAYVTSCQHSMMRAMNDGREFIGGIYWGRFLYSDIYEFLTPCEIIGSMVANGISGYSSYGMCGLDDGGVLHRMPKVFLDSLEKGNKWAKTVIPMIEGKRKKQIAILFPSAMALIEPMSNNGNKERRCDLLGFYKMCCDFGYFADVIDLDIISSGRLDEYEALIIPENDCYAFDVNSMAEQEIKRWTQNGGIIISSVGDEICKNVFKITAQSCSSGAIWYEEGGLVQSDRFEYFTDGECIAHYWTDEQLKGEKAVVMHKEGKGKIYSFGFAYGYSYCAKKAPHVPLGQKNNELYPVPMMKRNIVDDIFTSAGITKAPIYGKNIETAQFDNSIIVVNHTSHPIELDIEGEKVFEYEINQKILMPRSAVYIKQEVK